MTPHFLGNRGRKARQDQWDWFWRVNTVPPWASNDRLLTSQNTKADFCNAKKWREGIWVTYRVGVSERKLDYWIFMSRVNTVPPWASNDRLLTSQNTKADFCNAKKWREGIWVTYRVGVSERKLDYWIFISRVNKLQNENPKGFWAETWEKCCYYDSQSCPKVSLFQEPWKNFYKYFSVYDMVFVRGRGHQQNRFFDHCCSGLRRFDTYNISF